jgi:hypothetical protein
VDRRREQHRVLGPQRVRRPLRAAAVPAAAALPGANVIRLFADGPSELGRKDLPGTSTMGRVS